MLLSAEKKCENRHLKRGVIMMTENLLIRYKVKNIAEKYYSRISEVKLLSKQINSFKNRMLRNGSDKKELAIKLEKLEKNLDESQSYTYTQEIDLRLEILKEYFFRESDKYHRFIQRYFPEGHDYEEPDYKDSADVTRDIQEVAKIFVELLDSSEIKKL